MALYKTNHRHHQLLLEKEEGFFFFGRLEMKICQRRIKSVEVIAHLGAREKVVELRGD